MFHVSSVGLLLLLQVLHAEAAPADYDRLVATAKSYVEMGRVERAVDLAQTAAARAPQRPEAYVVWGRALASQNVLEDAAAKYEQARTLGSRDRELFVELTSVYDVSRAYEKAIAVYGDWLDKTPDDAEMHAELALTLLLLNRFPDAVAHLRQAARLQPANLQTRQDLGYALLRNQDLTGASSTLEAVLAADPQRPEALVLLAQTRAAMGHSIDALPLLDRALGLDPKNVRAVRVRARLRQLTHDAPAALGDYQTLLAENPQDAAALLGAAGALIALGRLNEATPLVAKARDRLGDHPDVRFREAQIAWRQGDRAAVATLRKMADAMPNQTEIWDELATAAKKLGDKRLSTEAGKHLAGDR